MNVSGTLQVGVDIGRNGTKTAKNGEKWQKQYTDAHLHGARHGLCHHYVFMAPTREEIGMQKIQSRSRGDCHTCHGICHAVQNGENPNFVLVATATSLMASAMQFGP